VRVGIRLTDPALLDRIVERLPPAWKPARSAVVDQLFSVVAGGTGRRGTQRFHIVYSDADMIARTVDIEPALQQLDVNLQLHVAESSALRVFVHAGVVGWKGRAIVIPGRSCSGKSTLVASLVRAGAQYYSDEYALLDRRGRVHPYPVPLALGKRRSTGRQRLRVSPDELGGQVGTQPLPVGMVLVTRYSRGSRFRARRLSRAQAMLELLQQTVRARRAPADVLGVLSRATAGGVALKSVRGEADRVARELLDEAPL